MTRNIIYKNVGTDLELHVSDQKESTVKLITDQYLFTDETVDKISKIFECEMNYGLMKNPPKSSSLQMANTFIPKPLSGDEQGEFLALDLGGTNFRVIYLKLNPNEELISIVKYYSVPENLRLGEGVLLFDFLAECIKHFLELENFQDKKLSLGFCFSFPMIQTGIDKGILVTWTKSFNCKNVVGEEVVAMLRQSLLKIKVLNVEIVAVVNDVTGTMIMGSYLDKRSAIGLILGTGCNASYFEQVHKIEKWEGPYEGVKEVIIDIEWGAFGDNGVLDFFKTDVDFGVDNESLLIHSFTFEKLFAGKYIGSIVKKILCKLIKEKVLFDSEPCLPSDNCWDFAAADVSHTLEGKNYETIFNILASKGFLNATKEDAEIIHHVCAAVSVRGSLIVSICLANLLCRMERTDVTIAVDGSLFKLHPKYKLYMEKFIGTLAPNRKFQLILAEDGSGKGAGLVAAVVNSLKPKSFAMDK